MTSGGANDCGSVYHAGTAYGRALQEISPHLTDSGDAVLGIGVAIRAFVAAVEYSDKQLSVP